MIKSEVSEFLIFLGEAIVFHLTPQPAAKNRK